MARRLFFRSSRPTLSARPLSAPRRLARGVLLAAAAAGVAYFLLPFRSSGADQLRRHFTARRTDFVRLRDMIAAEPSLASIGVDNVGEYWLFDGSWTASDRRFVAYSRREMLEAAGLPSERYERYLALLGRVGAYRVARQNVLGAPLRGTVFLFPDPQGRGPVTNIVFSQRPPEPLLAWDAAERNARPTYASLDDGWYVEFRRR